MLRVRTVVALLLAPLIVPAACKREEHPPRYPGAGPRPAPTPFAPQPAPAPSPAPAPAPPAPPAPSGPTAAAGFPCNYDTDMQCPFARCVVGRCGGCRSEADCKPGAACLSTPVGLACMPSASAPPPTTAAPAPAPPAPTPGPAPTPAQPVAFAAERERCVQRTNDLRAARGVPAVTRRADREACADEQARADATASAPHGSFGKCGEAAQNECPGWKGSAETTVDSCLKTMFDEGPGAGAAHGHYNNMMDPGYRGVACGFFLTADGSVWLVQDFFR